MYCVFCGAENPEFASFCEKCGKSVNWRRPQHPTGQVHDTGHDRDTGELQGSECSDGEPLTSSGDVPTPNHQRKPLASESGEEGLGEASVEDDGNLQVEHVNEAESGMPKRKRRRGSWIVAWFAALLVLNIWSLWPQNADKGNLYVFLAALSQLTTPIQLVLSAIVVSGILSWRKMYSQDGKVQNVKTRRFFRSPRSLFPILVGIVALVFIGGLVVSTLRSKSTNRLPSQPSLSTRQARQDGSINPHALDDWEILSKSKADLGSEDDGITPEAKKRMREMFALQMAGAMKQQNNPLHVEVLGRDHDVLLFQLPSMNDAVANELIKSFRKEDGTNFWNGMRLMGYSELVFSGDSYRKTLSRKEFVSYSKHYEEYKSAFLKAMKGMVAGAQGELAKP